MSNEELMRRSGMIPENGKRPRGKLQKTWPATFAEDLKDVERNKESSLRSPKMEKFRRPMFLRELEELSLSLIAKPLMRCAR